MARYDLRVDSSVARDLRGVPPADVRRILAKIESLRDDPRPPGAEKLSAQERYRVRRGDYRILYTIADGAQVVEVVKVAHRRDVYRSRLAEGRRNHRRMRGGRSTTKAGNRGT